MQKTLREAVRFSGRGLHSGVDATLTVEPAPAGSGLRFVRTDRPGAAEGRVTPAAVQESARCTRLVWGDTSVMTPEHLLAALGGLGISNARLCLDGPEVPILDGSAAPFAAAFVEAGLAEQGEPVPVWRPRHPVAVHDGNAVVIVRPAEQLSITYMAAYPHPLVGTQIYEYTTETDFLSQVAPARTFGFQDEIDALRAQGLIAGGTLECAVVVGPEGYPSPLRYPDELVRHKVLDLIGDLAVLGQTLAAHVVAIRSSHRLHARLLRALEDVGGAAPAAHADLLRRTP